MYIPFILIICAISSGVHSSPQYSGWLGSLYDTPGGNAPPVTPARPVVLLQETDQTTDCCVKISILPKSDLQKCANRMSNSSLVNIEREKCILDCFTTRTNITIDGKISAKKAYETFNFTKEYEKNSTLLKEIIKNCATAANDLQSKLPQTLNDGHCSPGPTLLVACISGALLKNCPISLRSTSTDCGMQFDAMNNCDVYLMPQLSDDIVF